MAMDFGRATLGDAWLGSKLQPPEHLIVPPKNLRNSRKFQRNSKVEYYSIRGTASPNADRVAAVVVAALP